MPIGSKVKVSDDEEVVGVYYPYILKFGATLYSSISKSMITPT